MCIAGVVICIAFVVDIVFFAGFIEVGDVPVCSNLKQILGIGSFIM